jgi:hypothetical protein
VLPCKPVRRLLAKLDDASHAGCAAAAVPLPTAAAAAAAAAVDVTVAVDAVERRVRPASYRRRIRRTRRMRKQFPCSCNLQRERSVCP